jgi:hypothetical protein
MVNGTSLAAASGSARASVHSMVARLPFHVIVDGVTVYPEDLPMAGKYKKEQNNTKKEIIIILLLFIKVLSFFLF